MPALTNAVPLSIDAPATPDANNQDGELLVTGFVYDPVATHAQPSQATELALEDRTRRRFACQSVDRLHDATTIAGIDPLECLGGARFNPDRVDRL